MRSLIRLLPIALTLVLAGTALAEPRHGIAMHGDPALPPDFKSLPYVNPDAPQGGALRVAVVGSFDSVNPFLLKGTAAQFLRAYTFESLMGRNGAEPFSLYGLLAESIDVSDDRQTFTFRLRPEAKFSDGSPVTAADVVFSMETLRDLGHPNFKDKYRKVSAVEAPDDRTVVFHQTLGDRELPLIVGLMPIISKAFWQGKDFTQPTLTPVMGSGPYMVGAAKPGESITFTKNPNYWGKGLAISRGLWNFDSVRFDYFRDANAAFEAFKKGDIDIRIEGDPGRWTAGYDFPAVAEGKVIKELVAQKTPAPAAGFAFNTRRALFADPRVREALLTVFDFEWANANLFGGAYRRSYGYYSGSALSSRGKPVDEAERAVLGEAVNTLRADFVDGSYALPVSDGTGRDRKMLKKAVELLAQAGWTISGNGMANAKGEPFHFTITLINRDQEKIALYFQRLLKQIGIAAEVKLVDATQFAALLRTYDYDMVPVTWFNSLSPGNEQNQYFGSDGREQPGSRNYPGIADKGVDAAIAAMLAARDRAGFEAAVRAEDRLLTSGFYMIPFYDAGGAWVARWNSIGRPDSQPDTGFEMTTLWRVQ